jgi:hypothetical protein
VLEAKDCAGHRKKVIESRLSCHAFQFLDLSALDRDCLGDLAMYFIFAVPLAEPHAL